MLLPITAKNDLETFQRQFAHQRGRRKQFKLSGYDLALHSEIEGALTRLLSNRFAEAEQLIHLRNQFERSDEEVLFAQNELSELGLSKLDLHEHVQAERKLREFVLSEPKLASAQVEASGRMFHDPGLERTRLSTAKFWEEAQEHRDDQNLIKKLTGLLEVSFVSSDEYDLSLGAEIQRSDVFKSMAASPQQKVYLGSDGDLHTSLNQAEFEMKFYFWTLTGGKAILTSSNKGVITIPQPQYRLEDPFARYWPSGEAAFPLQTTIAAAAKKNQKHLKQLSNAIRLMDDRQKGLELWMGGRLASIFARLTRPLVAYRVFFYFGGLGCSSALIYKPWRDVLVAISVLFVAHQLYDLRVILQTAADFEKVGSSMWVVAVLRAICIFLLMIAFIAQAITGVGVLHGTLLRGLNRQPINGSTNLPETGKTNFILRLMRYPKSSV